jgi:hypothetical protein
LVVASRNETIGVPPTPLMRTDVPSGDTATPTGAAPVSAAIESVISEGVAPTAGAISSIAASAATVATVRVMGGILVTRTATDVKLG